MKEDEEPVPVNVLVSGKQMGFKRLLPVLVTTVYPSVDEVHGDPLHSVYLQGQDLGVRLQKTLRSFPVQGKP